jgi:hypothetical protein
MPHTQRQTLRRTRTARLTELYNRLQALLPLLEQIVRPAEEIREATQPYTPASHLPPESAPRYRFEKCGRESWAVLDSQAGDALVVLGRYKKGAASLVELLEDYERRLAALSPPLPRPRLRDGKATVISCPMSATQRAIQDPLVVCYDRLRSQKIDPRIDNGLSITTDGRKLALDARLIAQAEDDPASKINALVETVTAIWRRTDASRGTQLIFCDMGVNRTPWGYSVYEDAVDKLVRNGLPRGDIAAIGDADTDAKKQALFDKVRAGTMRVLIGSTQKIGTGTNVQHQLVALHRLDAPWKSAEVQQRDGRILRQGNAAAEVLIYRYVTEGSFDAYMDLQEGHQA